VTWEVFDLVASQPMLVSTVIPCCWQGLIVSVLLIKLLVAPRLLVDAGTWLVMDGEVLPYVRTFAELHPGLGRLIVAP